MLIGKGNAPLHYHPAKERRQTRNDFEDGWEALRRRIANSEGLERWAGGIAIAAAQRSLFWLQMIFLAYLARQMLQSLRFGHHTMSEKYLSRVIVLERRVDSGALRNLTISQRYLYEIVREIAPRASMQTVHRRQLQEFQTPSFNPEDRNNFITDFCYNKVNIEDNENKFLLCTQRGQFKFVDFDWFNDTSCPITWHLKGHKEFLVGNYKFGKYNWNFEELRRYLSLLRSSK
jgi:hypothetical protein